MRPHTAYSKHKELLQSCYWKLEVNPTYCAVFAHRTIILCQWHNTREVTNCTARRMQESISCYDNFKYLAKIRKACQGVVGLCQKIMTPQWNNCASFFVVVTVIQIMRVTEGAALLEQSSCVIAFDFVGKNHSFKNVKFMVQCTKDESWARLVDPRIMEQKTNFCCPGYIFSFAQPFSPKILFRFH